MKKIVLITTGQPSVNPRIVKEADAFYNQGYEVTLLYCFFIPWAQQMDIALLQNVGWNYKLVGGTPTNNKLLYNFTRLRFKIARVLNNFFGNKFGIAENAQARAYKELLKAAKTIKADWYIGHNLGAIAVASKTAKYNNAKAGFDFEDYHRGEEENVKKYVLSRTIFLENKYVPTLNYFSAASDLILSTIQNDFPTLSSKAVVVYNAFPLSQLQNTYTTSSKSFDELHLFWFSQTIGLNRGLEVIIEALKLINDKNIHLTLAGRSDDTFTNFLERNAPSLKDNIHFAGIIPPSELPTFSAQFDIGLALELSTPYNRDICLTNKIFTYLLAGNAIIFSDTKAQVKFNNENKVGIVCKQNSVMDFVNCINFYKSESNLTTQKSYNKLLAANKFNWKMESEKLVDIVS